MSITSQLPQVVMAARSGALQALALQAGQTLVGTVIGLAPNGGTQVQISGQMLNLLLPALAKAGETLKFEVQGSGPQLRLALQPAPAPSNTPQPGSPLPAQTASIPLPPVPTPPPPAFTNVQTPIPQPTVQGTLAVRPPPTPQAPVATPPPAATTGATAPVATPPTTALPVSGAAPAVTATLPNVGATVAPGGAAPIAAAAGVSTQVPTPAYPQAPPATPAVAQQGTAVSPAAVSSGQVQATAPPVGQHAALLSSPPSPSTPLAALAQMVQASVPTQGGVNALTSALASIAGKVVLPEPVARAAQQVLAGGLSLEAGKASAIGLQRAVQNSGIFQEATLMRGSSTLLQPDMKSALLALRQTLSTWVGQQAPIVPVNPMAPPMRGVAPRAKGSDIRPIDPVAAPEEVGKQLLERTESALSRLRLHQSASLPDTSAKAGTDWSMDLPVMIGSHHTLLHLQIHRDTHSDADNPGERGWQMRFAINVPGLGEVGAQVSLRATTTGIMLWASERAASDALEAEVATLRETLVDAGLQPGAIVVRHGEPPAPPAPSGHFVDART